MYRFFANSHIYLGFELLVALVLFSCYTTSKQYFGLTWAIWLTVISLMFGPFWFNPLSFETSKVVEDYRKWLTWMDESGGTSDQSWETWWREEQTYLSKLHWTSTLVLTCAHLATHGVLALGILGKDFMFSPKEQNRVLVLLTVFAGYVMSTSCINKLERAVSYAVRRLAMLMISTVTFGIVIYLYASHLLYFKYTVAIYYILACFSFILQSRRVLSIRFFFRIHDYCVGHTLFVVLFLLSLFQVGVVQTWLLYHNALSAGVEIEAVLKYARKTKERASALRDPNASMVEDLKRQVSEQSRVIRALVTGLGNSSGSSGGRSGMSGAELPELQSLLSSWPQGAAPSELDYGTVESGSRAALAPPVTAASAPWSKPGFVSKKSGGATAAAAAATTAVGISSGGVIAPPLAPSTVQGRKETGTDSKDGFLFTQPTTLPPRM